MVHIQIDKSFRSDALEQTIRGAAEAAMKQQGLAGEMSIRVSGDAQMRALNKAHRGEDQATDVLSFPGGQSNPESGDIYLGDIVIAYPTAQRQASAAGHPVEAEVQLLVVHGVLHLAGHDHGAPKKKAAMWAAQAEILEALGLEIRSAEAEGADG